MSADYNEHARKSILSYAARFYRIEKGFIVSSELGSCASRFELVRLDRPQWRSIVQRFVCVCSEV